MVQEDDFRSVRKKRDIFDQVKADLRVPLHEFALFGSEGPWLKKDAIGHAEFPDVVQVGAPGKASQFLLLPPIVRAISSEYRLTRWESPAVSLIAKVDGRATGFERVFVALLDLFQSGLQLLRTFPHDFLEALPVILDFLLEAALVQGVFETGHDRAFAQRYDPMHAS